MAGGTGTRLWPLSRKSYPKQFSLELNGQSLFQEAASKFLAVDGGGGEFSKPSCDNKFRFSFYCPEATF